MLCTFCGVADDTLIGGGGDEAISGGRGRNEMPGNGANFAIKVLVQPDQSLTCGHFYPQAALGRSGQTRSFRAAP